MVEEKSNETHSNPSILVEPPENVAIPHIVTGGPPLNIEWCWIPGGPFTMGSEEFDETPIRTVDLPSFWLARYPVTNAQFRHFVGSGYRQSNWWCEDGWEWRKRYDIDGPRLWADSMWNGANQPVIGVSWYEAKAFARWAADVVGELIRLPTEAEWEKAARNADGRTYPWGYDKPTDELCNFGGNEGKTTPVGKYSPAGDGPYGNIDLAGNISEWTSSIYQFVMNNGRVLHGIKEGNRVSRGQWFNAPQWAMRATSRGQAEPTLRGYIGFRLAASVDAGS